MPTYSMESSCSRRAIRSIFVSRVYLCFGLPFHPCLCFYPVLFCPEQFTHTTPGVQID